MKSLKMANRVGGRSISKPSKKKQKLQQITLHKFFQASGPSTSAEAQPHVVDITAQSKGIHIYSDKEIAGADGLLKEYYIFWNAQARELCSSPPTLVYLNSTKKIEGAINTKWTLYKSELLELLADEVSVLVSEAYTDPVAQSSTMITIENNKKKVRDLTDICIIERDADKIQEERITRLTKDLRLAQSALKKAIDRKKSEMEHVKFMSHTETLLTTEPPEQPSQDEIDCIVADIRDIYQQSLSDQEDDNTSQVSESSHSDAPSPEIPLLPGLRDIRKQ